MKKIGLLLVCFYAVFIGHTQDTIYEWGKITNNELTMSQYKPDSAADAVILLDFGSLKYDMYQNQYRQILQRHIRIKVFKNPGVGLANIKISYYNHENREQVVDIEALSYNLNEDGSVKKTILDSKHIYDENINSKYHRKKFAIPNVMPGTVFEYRYTVVANSNYIPEWKLQKEFPVAWSEFTAEIPNYYEYLILLNNTKTLDIKTEEPYVQYIPWEAFSAVHSGNMAKINGKRLRYVKKEIPALIEEKYLTSINNYSAKITFQLSSTFYPGHELKKVLTTWEDLADNLLDKENKYFGMRLKGFSALKTKAREFGIDFNDTAEIVQAVYEYVVNNFRWNEVHNIGIHRSLKEVFETKSGSGVEINMILMLMLQELSIDAKPVLLSTRDNGHVQKTYPDANQFNHVICYVELNSKSVLIDAIDPFYPYNLMPFNDLNQMAFVVDKNNPHFIDIDDPPVSKVLIKAQSKVQKNKTISGVIDYSFQNYSAVKARRTISQTSLNEFIKEEINPEFTIDSTVISGMDDKYSPLNLSLHYTLDHAISGFDSLIFVPVVFYNKVTENPFRLDHRSYPVEYGYSQEFISVNTIQFYEDLTINTLPKAQKLVLPNSGGFYLFNIANQTNSIQVINKLKLNRATYSTEEYYSLKNLYGQILSKQDEMVELVQE